MQLSDDQLAMIHADVDTTIFLEGPAGTGKTTAGVGRLAHLLDADVPADSVLVMVPQRTLALPYYEFLRVPELAAGGQVTVTTLGGMARRAVDLFWPLVAEQRGFHHPERRPTFLSLETAQYYVARVVGPVIEREGYFDTITIDRNRLYSQVIDNLNKAALVGFPYTEIGARLKSAWTGDVAQLRMYDDAQTCANLFREYCLEHNLLDFSLQVDILMNDLWELPQYNEYVTAQYSHLIVDNIEEDSPASHAVINGMIETTDSALIIYDTQAGYRRFLGADPDSAATLRNACKHQVRFTESFVTSPQLTAFAVELAESLRRLSPDLPLVEADPRDILHYDNYRYHPQMIDGVAEAIAALVHGEGVNPNEIVVLAPYLSDALRFSLMNRLEEANVPVRSHRPSRSLREEPAARCLLTLAQLAHPEWGLRPTQFDVVYALIESITELDLVRAQLLAQNVFKLVDRLPRLEAFDQVKPAVHERVTFVFGERYDRLRGWLEDYVSGEPVALDHFFSRLFGEVLSQPGFGFHDDFDAVEVTANLIDSAQRFRWIVGESGTELDGKSVAQEYVGMVSQGIIADQYLRSWEVQTEEAVLVAPAYTFLMSNRPVDYQFWLNVSGYGWSERLYQPLTNPYVLNLQWQEGDKWTDDREVEIEREALFRLTLGLIRRCRKQIYLGFSELGEQGYEQRGELLKSIQMMLRRLPSVD